MNTKSAKLLHIAGRANWISAEGSVTWIHGKTGDLMTSFGCNNNGYRQIEIRGKKFYVHRLIAMTFLDNYSDELQVDHVDGDKTNNNASNIRMATQQQNQRGFRTKPRNCSSQYRGVHWSEQDKKWKSQITVDDKQKHLGCFDSERGAALAWNEAALEFGYLSESLNTIID